MQELVEGSFGRLFGGQLEPLDVASRLAWAMEDSSRQGQATPAFDVAMNPQDLALFPESEEDLAAALADAAWQLARQSGSPLATKPVIRVVPDLTVRRHMVEIASRSAGEVLPEPLQATQVVGQQDAGAFALAELQALEAFLIVQGRRHFPLDKPLITIGRRTDNDVVLDVSTVSRQHAQIRWRSGKFLLYDVSNRGRTSVNGVPVTEHVLRPGDVVALSDATLIYGEGPAASAVTDDGTKTRLRRQDFYD